MGAARPSGTADWAGLSPQQPQSLARRVFKLLAYVSVAVAVVMALGAVLVYQATVVSDARREMQQQAAAIADVVGAERDPVHAVARISVDDLRVTLISADGTVLYDSQEDAGALPNHGDRPEVHDALAADDGTGWAERESETLGYVSLYAAQRLADGDVLRLSEERAGLVSVLMGDLLWIGLIVVVLVAVSAAVSHRLARRLVAPVLAIDPAHKARAPYVELGPLVDRLNEQHAELKRQNEQLREADSMRAHFMANVTHELKTPIASIQGAAELIASGICRPEDIGGFAERIYGDARRLSALVSDILLLSKLEAGERARDATKVFGAREPVDLLAVARDVAMSLEPLAERHGVQIRVAGIVAVVDGYPRQLDEICRNLVSNAIRYGGTPVTVRVLERDGHAQLTVTDHGPGVPADEQEKVFERFYRVDKSRSREGGGTGLGLAIVKHAAALNGGTVSLESEPGRCSFTVTF